MSISKLNFVNVGRGATFHPSGQVQSTPGDVDDLLEHLRAVGNKHVVIHLHGGLVPEKDGMAIAEKMVEVYEVANAHPISLVYETGFLRTLAENLNRIHELELFRKLLALVRRFAADKLKVSGLEAAVSLPDLERPATELEQDPYFTSLERAARDADPQVGLEAMVDVEAELQQIEAWVEADEELRGIVARESEDPLVQSNRVRSEEGLEGLLTWAALVRTVYRIGRRVVARLLSRRDHGAYCTIVEEVLREAFLADLGQWTWDSMKERAALMFRSNEGREGMDQFAGRYLLDGLARLQAENPEFTLDVVGHSLGSVATCRLLEAMEGSLRVRRIAFLAPAVRTEVAHKELFSQPGRCDQFRLFTMSDDYEKSDRLVPIVYPRSLLYFISGVLERSEVDETLLGMARHLSERTIYCEAHIEDIRAYLDAASDRVVWSVSPGTAPEGQRSTSTTHGGFDDDDPTRASLTHFLSG